jgi:hypothetical protein
LKHYQQLAQDLSRKFSAFNIVSISRMQNASADLLANVASRLIPPKDFSPDRFSVELIFRPYVPNNITNWHVFNDDVDIINFLSSEGTYENDIIDEESHDLELNKSSPEDKIKSENIVPKSVVKLEDLYDLKDRFKKPTNCKTHSSTMSVELINLGT